LSNRSTAVTAHIGERLQSSVPAARQQDRHASDIVGYVVARPAQPRAQPCEYRPTPEQHSLGGGTLGTAIGGDTVGEHLSGEVGRTIVDMPEEALAGFPFVLAIHGPSSITYRARRNVQA
jgi:hypothetical protein